MGSTAAIITAGIGTGLSAAGQLRAGSQARQIGELNAAAVERSTRTNVELVETGTKENVALLRWNARMAEAQARDAIRRGRETETRYRTDVRGLIGEQRAAFAAQGVDVGHGSALDVQADTAYLGELDALTIRTNAAREAWGFQVDAEAERRYARSVDEIGGLEARSVRETGAADAASARIGGRQAQSASRFGAASTILSGSADVLYQRYGFQRRAS